MRNFFKWLRSCAAIVSAVAVLVGAFWFVIAKPHAEDYVDLRVDQKVNARFSVLEKGQARLTNEVEDLKVAIEAKTNADKAINLEILDLVKKIKDGQ